MPHNTQALEEIIFAVNPDAAGDIYEVLESRGDVDDAYRKILTIIVSGILKK